MKTGLKLFQDLAKIEESHTQTIKQENDYMYRLLENGAQLAVEFDTKIMEKTQVASITYD